MPPITQPAAGPVLMPVDLLIHLCCTEPMSVHLQAQYGHMVVQMLMNHLDENSKKDAKIKASIVDVLAETVLIAAGGSIGSVNVLGACLLPACACVVMLQLQTTCINLWDLLVFVPGPSVLDVFNTLLKHLRVSVDADPRGVAYNDEKNFQEAVINTIGEQCFE